MGFTYALNHIAEELQRVKFVGVDTSYCGCIVRSNHGQPYACGLARYVLDSIPLEVVHFQQHGSTNQNEEFFEQQEFDAISHRLKESQQDYYKN